MSSDSFPLQAGGFAHHAFALVPVPASPVGRGIPGGRSARDGRLAQLRGRGVPVLALLAAPASAAPATRAAHTDAYLSILARSGAVTPATVARLHARQVDYYGHPMSADAVYRDKLAFVRLWPVRAYAAVPGTLGNDCTDATPRCRVSAVMRWSRADRAGRREAGADTVRLDLARENGMLKIVRESGAPFARRDGSHPSSTFP